MGIILITNDDGINSEGIIHLKEAVSELGKAFVFAPAREMSATSHSLTLHKQLYIEKVEDNIFSVDGTPTDCVLYAVRGILKKRPDIIVSGINQGANLGEDVTYSGTVAAAFEGMLLGIPSIAYSLTSYKIGANFHYAKKIAEIFTKKVLEWKFKKGISFNVNIPGPDVKVEGVKFTRLGKRIYRDSVIEKISEDNKKYYILGGEPPTWIHGKGTDFSAIENHYISITPLHLNLTDFETLKKIKSAEKELTKALL